MGSCEVGGRRPCSRPASRGGQAERGPGSGSGVCKARRGQVRPDHTHHHPVARGSSGLRGRHVHGLRALRCCTQPELRRLQRPCAPPTAEPVLHPSTPLTHLFCWKVRHMTSTGHIACPSRARSQGHPVTALPPPLIARPPAQRRAAPASDPMPLPADALPTRGKERADGLRAAREANRGHALPSLTTAGTLVRFGRCIGGGPGRRGHAGRLAQPQTAVHRRGRQARCSAYARTGMTTREPRPQRAPLDTTICQGHLHGIAAACPMSVSVFHEAHAQTLTAVTSQRAGVLHARAR